KRIGGTYYSIGIVPLGGYVRMVGDDPHELADAQGEGPKEQESEKPSGSTEFMFQDGGGYDEVDKALMADRSKWFLEKGYLTKMAVVLAGPGFNILFAWLLAIGTFWYFGIETPVDRAVIGDTIPGYPAEKAGLKSGDRVLSIDGQQVSDWRTLADIVRDSGGRELVLLIERQHPEGGTVQKLEIKVTGEPEDPELALLTNSEQSGSYLIGIRPGSQDVSVSLGEAFSAGSYHVLGTSVLTVRSLWLMLKGAISAKNIGGPIAIVKQAAVFAERGVAKLSLFIVFLSISLGIINLFPIPVLDGGHLLFFTIELFKGAPLSLRFKEVTSQIGLVLLLALMLFAIGNDIINVAN
ncbi:MAG: RIP metalloprotease RseP, partial [Deltaproteobacteria bacterium]|nr:RIP metalloprotease RseP [Deltaproteobacteria bacterium]